MMDAMEARSKTKETTGSDFVDILQIYFREISRFPVLSQQEERELAYDMAADVDGARERLITSNLRLVVKIAESMLTLALRLSISFRRGTSA